MKRGLLKIESVITISRKIQENRFSRNSSAAKAAIRRFAFGDPLQCCDMEELVMSMLLNGAVNSACVQERVLHVRCKAIPKLEPKSLSQIEVVNLAYRNMPVNTF